MIDQVKLTLRKEITSAKINQTLVSEISQLIDNAKLKVVREYNVTKIQLCWLIGNRINTEILNSQKAQYGEQVIEQLADELTLKYGRGFSRPNLFKMVNMKKEN